ncbi:MAG: phosphomannomutase/phosphoglucomutase [Treponema sp.]
MTNSEILKLQNGSDIRGTAVEGVEDEHVNLTEDVCNRIGQAFSLWLAAKLNKPAAALKIGIGRDARISGPALGTAAAHGIAAQGCTVVDCKLATTPAMFMSIVFPETKYDGAVMITASHLPFNRNGIKFFDKEGGLEHEDITAILEKACSLPIVKADISKCSTFELLPLYAEHLKNTICRELNADENSKPLKGLKIVVDAGNGDAGFFVSSILNPLGADTTGSQFLDPDGMFPNHIPNPENKTAMKAIRSATVNNHADLGLIFDTDVDRMSAVFHTGTEVNRDAIIALVSAILAPSYPGGTIVTDSVTSDRLTVFLQDILGMKHLRYMRGYKNVIDKCKELNRNGIISPLAMETSGHGALKDNYYLDDGAFLAVKLIIAVAQASKEGKKIDSLIEKLPPLIEEEEYRFKINAADFKAYGSNVLAEFKKRAENAGYDMPESYEGIRISFHDSQIQGWMLLRMSLHDPVMPLNIEGGRKGDLAKIVKIAQNLLSGFDRLDMSSLK